MELGAVLGLDGGDVSRARAGVDEEFAEAIHADAAFGSAADHGEHLTVDDTQTDTTLHVFLAEGHLFEELLHEGFFAFGGMLDEAIVHLFGLGHLTGRDILDLGSAVAILEDQHLHEDEVDDGVEVFTGAHGILDRGDLVAEILLQVADGIVEVGIAVVELVEEEHHGFLGGHGVTPSVLGGGFDAGLGVDGHDGGIGSGEAGYDVTGEIGEAGSVEDVDLLVVDDGVHHRGVDGDLTIHLDLTIVGNGVLFFRASFSVDDLAFEKHVFSEGGLAGLGRTDQGDVPDLVGLEFLHFI